MNFDLKCVAELLDGLKLSNRQPCIILCEGESERTYVQMINKLFKFKDTSCVVFKAVCVQCGYWDKLQKAYKKACKDNPKCSIFSFIDHDIYLRESDMDRNGKYFNLLNDDNIIAKSVLFSHMNFEDVLMLHLDKKILKDWIDVMNAYNHFNAPLFAKEYVPIFDNFCNVHKDELPDNWSSLYVKGVIPFELTKERILTMVDNLSVPECPIKFQFGELIKYLYLDKKLIDFRN